MWWVCSVFTLPLQKQFKIIAKILGSPKSGSYIYGVRLIDKIKIKVMITNVDFLIQKYAEAREKVNNAQGDRTYKTYWQGVMDTYHGLLTYFKGWASEGTGFYVFYEGMTYDEALNQTTGILK
jgi:hypothetical protein